VRDEEGRTLPFAPAGDHVVLRVRATPRASAARAGGLHRDADGRVSLIVKVTAPAEKGKANKAVIDTLARALRLARSRFAIAAGETDRNKVVSVTGDPAEITRALHRLLEQDR
jgi:uncharacterized protein (TIGR00251 family)